MGVFWEIMPPCRPPTGSKLRNVQVLLTFLMCVNLQHFVTERDEGSATGLGGVGDLEIFKISSKISDFTLRFQACPGYKGQLAVLELGASAIFQINAHAQDNKPAHFRDFNGDFPDFTKDFRISTEISRISRGFQRRFPDFAKDF